MLMGEGFQKAAASAAVVKGAATMKTFIVAAPAFEGKRELSSIFELFVELSVATRQRNLPAFDEEVTDVCARFKKVAVGDDEVGGFADFD